MVFSQEIYWFLSSTHAYSPVVTEFVLEDPRDTASLCRYLVTSSQNLRAAKLSHRTPAPLPEYRRSCYYQI